MNTRFKLILPVCLYALIGATTGCLSEQSFHVPPEDIREVATVKSQPLVANQEDEPLSARAWLVQTHEAMATQLPASGKSVLLSDGLRNGSSGAIDVYDHFGIRKAGLRTLAGNLDGIICTAQSASRDTFIDKEAPPWDGFEDVLVPIEDRFELSARLGLARRDGQVLQTDCIVVLPGLFGDNGVRRNEDMAMFLRDSGYHVLALEVRAHGQTEARHPELYHTWGVLEADDLMHVSDWLEAMPHVNRTGLMGYCWGANIALSTGWYDAVGKQDPLFSPRIRKELTADTTRPRYTAGIVLFSPILGWERLRDELETPRGSITDPVYHAIQETIRNRMIRKGYKNPSGSLKVLIEEEFEHCGVPLPEGAEEAFPVVRFLRYKNKPFHDKLSAVRTPMLFVHGANDPLSPAQEIADLVATTSNPNVAAIILPGGGHVGFAAYAKAYYFGLVANFFDPNRGPSPVAVPHAPTGDTEAPTIRAVETLKESPAHHASAATACRRQ